MGALAPRAEGELVWVPRVLWHPRILKGRIWHPCIFALSLNIDVFWHPGNIFTYYILAPTFSNS